jgi:LysM repeat protein
MAHPTATVPARPRHWPLHLLPVLLLSLTLLLPGSAAEVRAQAGNLLRNPGFEGAYHAWSGINEIQVADEWTPWWVAQQDSDPPEINRRPEYKRADGALYPNRVHSGSAAQQWFTFHATHIAGMYQQVSGIQPGKRLQFSIWAQAWSSSENDPNVSTDPGVINLQIGIDPTGNSNPWAGTVVWSGTYNIYDQWIPLSIDAAAQSGTVTVFMKSAPKYPVKHNDTYWDDAVLAVVRDAPPPPSATPETVPTATVATEPAPSASPTPALPTVTAAPTATCAPPPADWVPYVVQSGDYLTALSRDFDVSVAEIMAANCLNRTTIYTGETLLLPPLPPTATPPLSTATPAEPPTPEPTPTASNTPAASPTPVQIAAATLTSSPIPSPSHTPAPTEPPAEPDQPTEPAATATPESDGGPLDGICGASLAPNALLVGALLWTQRRRVPGQSRKHGTRES